MKKGTLLATYKTIIIPVMEFASTVWSPFISDTNLQKLQTTQNNALRIITGCTSDTSTQHLHKEIKILPMKETIFENWNRKTININNNSATPPTPDSTSQNLKKIHIIAVEECLRSYKPNPILSQPAPDINQSEQSLPRKTRRILAQLRAGRSPILLTCTQ